MMKTPAKKIAAVLTALILVSCDRRKDDLEEKLQKLEKETAAAVERQRALEEELSQQKLAAELSEIERERTRLEEERWAMENEKKERDERSSEELERRQRELEKRENRLAEQRDAQEKRQQELTGLEEKLGEKERDLAGRAPINSLPQERDVNYGRATGDYGTFYDSLSDYGSWFRTSEYGYVYQPTVVRDVSWRPYTRGRWALTNHGWTWVSSEPFGWACYHYGRWALLRGTGWVWVPGTEWAPAWVTWRDSPGYVGWAPLPPETLGWRNRAWDANVEVTFGIGSGWFTFVSYRNFGGSIQPYCLPVVQNTTIIQQTTNITIYQVRDSRIYVGGPSYRNVCDRIGRPFPIHHLSFRDDFPSRRGVGQWNNRFNGRELEVVAPRMGADWNAALSPVNIRKDLGSIEVDRPRDLSVDVRDHFKQSRVTERQRAEKVIAEAGGREQLDRYRRRELERNREMEKSDSGNVVDEERKQNAPQVIPSVPERQIRDRGPANPGGSKESVPVVPEVPSQPDAQDKPGTIVPKPTGLEEKNEPPLRVLPKPEVPGERGDRTDRGRDLEQEERRKAAEVRAQAERENVLREKADELRRDEELKRVEENDKRQVEAELKQKAEIREQQEERAKQTQEELERKMAQREGAEREQADEVRKRMEEARRQQEQMRKEQEDSARQKLESERIRREQQEAQKQQMEEALKQQEERARRQQEEMRRQQEEGLRREREERLREAQEQASRRQQEEVRKQQEESARRQQEERARELQEGALRRQQEELARRQQQEEMRRQQEEQVRKAREESGRRQQEEQARRQQEEMRREQQEQMRRQQEEMRRQREEQGRRQQEEIRRQVEERVRRQREGE